MIRLLYSLCIYLAMPLILLRLLWRARRNPAYRYRWAERFGYVPATIKSGVVWWHTVSVGETLAAIPLIKKFHARHPQLPLLVTTMTPTGSQQVQLQLKMIAQHVYLPYDAPGFIKRFLKTIQPRLGVIMETELWPNLLHYCQQQNIPTLLINARLSEKSYRGYHYLAHFTRQMLQSLTAIATQSQADATRFVQLGCDRQKITITGSIKWDITISIEPSKPSWLGQRLVWMVASTHPDEETMIIKAYQKIRQQFPELLLIWAPRHPERVPLIDQHLKQSGIDHIQCRRGQLLTPDMAVLLIDTIGELMTFYAYADVVFVGGSLINHGGHNMIEPAALAKAIVIGPYYFNFAAVVQKLQNANGLMIVADDTALIVQTLLLLSQPVQRLVMGKAAQQQVAQNQGATERQLAMIDDLLTH